MKLLININKMKILGILLLSAIIGIIIFKIFSFLICILLGLSFVGGIYIGRKTKK